MLILSPLPLKNKTSHLHQHQMNKPKQDQLEELEKTASPATYPNPNQPPQQQNPTIPVPSNNQIYPTN